MKAALASCGLALATTLAAGCASQARSSDGDPFVNAFARLKPSVVLLTMKIPSEDKHATNRFDEAYGTGVVVASDAAGSSILTVEHVIAGARDLRVTLDERRSVPARVAVSDTKNDLALVTIAVANRPVATLGSSARIAPGTQIGVAGYPIPDAFADEHLGTKTSVFAGRVSSVRDDSLELDLPVIPGESGGPIFDAQTGAVVALAESRFDDEKAIGFGIPVDAAKEFLRGRRLTSLR